MLAGIIVNIDFGEEFYFFNRINNQYLTVKQQQQQQK